MQKIEITLDQEQLRTINTMMNILISVPFEGQPRHRKSMLAICLELQEFLLKKTIEKRHSKKAFRLKMPYYKADALWYFLDHFHDFFNFAPESYEENVWRMIHSDLHKKLL